MNLTEEIVYLGVKNYLDYNDWDLVEQYNGYLICSLKEDGVYHAFFRSYTGAWAYYDTYADTGFTYETIKFGGETKEINYFYIQDYI